MKRYGHHHKGDQSADPPEPYQLPDTAVRQQPQQGRGAQNMQPYQAGSAGFVENER